MGVISVAGWDYADRFGTPAEAFHPAEAWGRAAFEEGGRYDVPAQLVWRGLLQLRLGSSRTTDHVAGWPILSNTPEELVVEAQSWHLTARLVVTSSPTGAEATTTLRFKNAAARAEWAALGWLHRRVVSPILAGAAQRLSK